MPGNRRRQGILRFQVQVTDHSDALTSRAGLPLVVETMRALGVPAAVAQHMKLQQRDGGLTDYQKLESVVVLMAAGGDCYDDMRVLQADEGLQRLVGYELPSPDAVRAYAKAFHDEQLIQQAKNKRPRAVVAYLPSESELLAGLAQVNVALCRAVAAQGKATRAMLDHDATIQESHKQQAQEQHLCFFDVIGRAIPGLWGHRRRSATASHRYAGLVFASTDGSFLASAAGPTNARSFASAFRPPEVGSSSFPRTRRNSPQSSSLGQK